jgi:hypothetical protein
LKGDITNSNELDFVIFQRLISVLWPANNNVDKDSIIPKMDPVIPKEYEAFFDMRPNKAPNA